MILNFTARKTKRFPSADGICLYRLVGLRKLGPNRMVTAHTDTCTTKRYVFLDNMGKHGKIRSALLCQPFFPPDMHMMSFFVPG